MSLQFAYISNSGFFVADKEDTYNSQVLSLEGEAKSFKYSPLGNFLVILFGKCLQLYKTRGGNFDLIRELAITNALDFSFSPRESYITVISRYVKAKEDEPPSKNLMVFKTECGEAVLSFVQKNLGDWRIEWTEDESYCAKQVSNEVQFYDSKAFDRGVHSRIKVEGIESYSISPGKRPSVAVFIKDKGSGPGSARIYDLGNFNSPLSQKSFFRADSVTFHWNNIGTNVLVFTHTDVDATGKSYYGETSLYFLSITGNFDCKVELKQAGPIHDVAWSPNSKEFLVVYGSMPAKSTLFDHRASPIYELGTGARNTIKYSPTGRFFFIAGFGNLAGALDVWERKSFTKITTISASNSSTCEWAADGRHILTSILYRRLKVDNGIKIWHYSGVLAHQIEEKEMYQTAWRPDDSDLWPERSAHSPIPTGIKSPEIAKPAGRYVPPGARNGSSHTIYDRDAIDKGMGRNRTPNQRKKMIPGKNAVEIAPPPAIPAEPTSGGSSLDTEKKIKGIKKKLLQINDLKMKQASGAVLELTQITKIGTEEILRKELESLTVSTS